MICSNEAHVPCCRPRSRRSYASFFLSLLPFLAYFLLSDARCIYSGGARLPPMFPPIYRPPMLDAQRDCGGWGAHQDCCQDFARLGSRIHEFTFAQRPFLETASRHKRGCALFPA